MKRMRDFGVASLKWNVYTIPLPSEFRGYVQRGAKRLYKPEVDDFKETVFSRQYRADAHMNSRRLWQHV